MLIYLLLSLLGGVVGGVLVPPIAESHRFGPAGNAITGFLGGAVAFVIVALVLGGTNLIVAFVTGFLCGALTRVGLAVLNKRKNGE